jgi:hypothetical protein
MFTAMSRETLEVLEERDALAARLAAVERAYGELLERVRLYERERAEIRGRLEGLIARIAANETH